MAESDSHGDATFFDAREKSSHKYHDGNVNQDDIVCYVHCVSPVRKTSDRKHRFFDCSVQVKETANPVRAICFSPERHDEFEKAAKRNSPVKVKSFTRNEKYDNIVIEKKTQLEDVPVPDNFVKKEMALPSGSDIQIKSLTDGFVASNQRVTLKVRVSSLQGKKVFVSNNTTFSKQEAVACDCSGTIALKLWDQFVDSVSEGKTYILKDFLFKNDKYGISISSAKSGSSVEETEEFSDKIAEPDIALHEITTKSVTVEVCGVSSVTKYYGCSACKRKVAFENGSESTTCGSCGLGQRKAACACNWLAKLYVKLDNDEKVYLTAFNSVVQKIADHFSIKLHSKMPEVEVKRKFYENLVRVNLTYDTIKKTILDLSIPDL